MLSPPSALPGRATQQALTDRHAALNAPLKGPFSAPLEQVHFGMGCFWGAERMFWALTGVHTTAVGYSAGVTPNPTYREVCSGLTGHNEVVLVVFDPAQCPFERLLTVFWEGHDPTQGMQQGNDRGTQYRSGIYPTTPEQAQLAHTSRTAYGAQIGARGYEAITTEIIDDVVFYYADDSHQQYLHKHPQGYCGLGGTGVSCQLGVSVDPGV